MLPVAFDPEFTILLVSTVPITFAPTTLPVAVIVADDIDVVAVTLLAEMFAPVEVVTAQAVSTLLYV
jgi:hypothetical protein